jgi:hypothetical protein
MSCIVVIGFAERFPFLFGSSASANGFGPSMMLRARAREHIAEPTAPQWSPQNRPFVVTSKPAILRLLLDISLGTASDRAANGVAVRSSLSSRLSQLFAVATFFGEKYCTRMA